MPLRVVASIALFTLLPVVSASAQFTTYVAPPARPVDSAAAAAADPAQRADSVQRVAITNMKAWVDSAAGEVVGRPLTSTDSLAGSTTTAVTATTTTAARTTTTTFRDGARAPDTATPLPTLALFGGAAVAAGLFLLRGKRA